MKENNYFKILPVGSVIKSYQSEEYLMIVSLLPLTEKDGELGYYDYGTALFPTGVSSAELIFLNHQDVEKIIFMGYIGEDYQKLIASYQKANISSKYKKLKLHNHTS